MVNRIPFNPLTLNDAATAAIKFFRDEKPWRGAAREGGDKFAELNRGLTQAYDMETMLCFDDTAADPEISSAGSGFDPRTNKIIIKGRLSVVTYLMLFAFARGANRIAALTFARQTFRH